MDVSSCSTIPAFSRHVTIYLIDIYLIWLPKSFIFDHTASNLQEKMLQLFQQKGSN
jgi:hypothetical protein